MTNLNSILKSRDIILLTKVHIVKTMVFPAVMYRCDDWTIKKVECQRTDAFELWCWIMKTLESPLDSKESKPVNPKGNQPWIFTGRTEVEVPILWPPDVKSQLIGKDSDAGKDWRQEEKGATADKMDGITNSMHMSLSQLAMATHSSTLAWQIPWTEESGGLQSMGLQRVGHDLVTEQQHVITDYLL